MKRKKIDPNDIYYDKEQKTAFEFPCQFPIKAMGRTGDELHQAVLEIAHIHIEDLTEETIKFNVSSNGKFTSITITFTAHSKDHLDKLYIDLTACEHVLYCL